MAENVIRHGSQRPVVLRQGARKGGRILQGLVLQGAQKLVARHRSRVGRARRQRRPAAATLAVGGALRIAVAAIACMQLCRQTSSSRTEWCRCSWSQVGSRSDLRTDTGVSSAPKLVEFNHLTEEGKQHSAVRLPCLKRRNRHYQEHY